MHIINFINHDTSMMSAVHLTKNGKYIVHLADLDSDMRVGVSRIFSSVDDAAAYAEKLVKTPEPGKMISGPVFQ